MWEKDSYKEIKWCVFYNYICKLKEIVADFIWYPHIKKVRLLFAAKLQVNNHGGP